MSIAYIDPPETVSVAEFMLNDEHLSVPLKNAKNPFTCGLSGRTYTALEAKERVRYLSRGIAKELGFEVNKGTEWEKMVAIYSLNTVSHKCILRP
jgi:hypothetical protein